MFWSDVYGYLFLFWFCYLVWPRPLLLVLAWYLVWSPGIWSGTWSWYWSGIPDAERIRCLVDNINVTKKNISMSMSTVLIAIATLVLTVSTALFTATGSGPFLVMMIVGCITWIAGAVIAQDELAQS